LTISLEHAPAGEERKTLHHPIAFIPGITPANPGPLARYLPPLPDGLASTWLSEKLPRGAWVLDPFGAAPRLALEAARAGCRVLVSANNPVSRRLVEMGARSPSESELRAALAELASSYKGQERIEPHIRALYSTECGGCGQPVMADYFVWERSVAYPHTRSYTCSRCGDSGERPTNQKDKERAASFGRSDLNRARALERVASAHDPDRAHAEEALSVYLPRAVYALFTLINKMDSLDISPERRNYLSALLLSTCDQANTLWSHPTSRERPRQLTIPHHFRENNVWLALEQSIHQWVSDQPEIPLTYWPVLCEEKGGITLFEGRLKDLGLSLSKLKIGAVMAALPRPNQAFWTLSALWAAWLWGRGAVGPFISVLRRRRYDWGWHTAALSSSFGSLAPLLEGDTPILGLIGEAEPGFLSAAILAGANRGFQLDGLALRSESGQAQIHWRRSSQKKLQPSLQIQLPDIAQEAAIKALKERGQPADYLTLQAAALTALAEENAFPRKPTGFLTETTQTDIEPSPAEFYSNLQNHLRFVFNFRSGFSRFEGSEVSLEVGSWWLRDETGAQMPLADRIELAIARYLQSVPTVRFAEIDFHLCALFPGLLTPDRELIMHCLYSYGEEAPPGSGQWAIRHQDRRNLRLVEKETTEKMLANLATRLGFSIHPYTIPGDPQATTGPRTVNVWLDLDGRPKYAFTVISTALIGGIIRQKRAIVTNPQPGFRHVIVLPGGRANLLAYKMSKDSRLRNEIEQGWIFLKYRHLRRLIENPLLSQENLTEQLNLDPLTYTATQMRLL
jgi:DNA-directed RNA polymerase subunit M/transcription elongation factor TFIIS